MQRRRIWLLSLLLVCIVALRFINRRWRPGPPAGTQTAAKAALAPDFSVSDLDGKKLTLSDYRGKVVLLNFWATWCSPCRTEIPHFEQMQRTYGSQGFQVIGISMDDDIEAVRAFRKENGVNYPIALGDAKLAESFGGILGLPVTFILDREGLVRGKFMGATDVSVFDEAVGKLLMKSD